jgi:hypothetical protein
MLGGAMARVFYRVIWGARPVPEDFKSARQLGKPALVRPEQFPLWDGLSVYATEQQARKKARSLRLIGHPIGDFIGEVHVPDDPEFTAERTTASPGHHTIWGPLHRLATYVRKVTPVDGVQ